MSSSTGITVYSVFHQVDCSVFRNIKTPSLPQPVKFPASKVHTYPPPNSIFDGPITHLLSILCTLIEIMSGAHARGGEKSLMILDFYWLFSECWLGKHGSERVKVLCIV